MPTVTTTTRAAMAVAIDGATGGEALSYTVTPQAQ